MRHLRTGLLGSCGLALGLLVGCGKDEEGPNPAAAPPSKPVDARAKLPAGVPVPGPGGKPPAPGVPPAPAPGRGALWFRRGACRPQPRGQGGPPLKQDVRSLHRAAAARDLDVIARVGPCCSNLREGEVVKAGELLFEIDPRTYQASVDQARGALAVTQAQREKTTADVARNRPLVEKNAISREEYETSVAIEKAAYAQVDAAQGAVERALIVLGYTQIVAPVGGLAGRLELSVGNVAGRGETTVLTRISVLDPIHAQIRVPETDILRYHSKRAGTARPKRVLDLFLSDGSKHAHRGEVAIVDRSIDPTTGTLLVEVAFPNPDQQLRPGFFARVRAVSDKRVGALLVPQRAVEELQGTYRVTVVGADGTAEVRPVKVGPRLGELWVIEQGLQEQDLVVVEGRARARSGQKVTPVQTKIEPTPDPAGAGK
jgi:membrane fusion protein (multidrug efflux system)